MLLFDHSLMLTRSYKPAREDSVWVLLSLALHVRAWTVRERATSLQTTPHFTRHNFPFSSRGQQATTPDISMSTQNPFNKLLHRLHHPQRPDRAQKEWTLQPQCPLLQLPGELRNQIYDYVLVNDTSKDPNPMTESDRLPHRIELRTLKIPALAATCRQIHTEALSYFFRHATFTCIIKIDSAMRCDYRLDDKSRRWLQKTGAFEYKIHDIVLGFERAVPESDNVVRFNASWMDKLFFKVRKRCMEKPKHAEEFSIATIAWLMVQWAWVPTTRIELTTGRLRMGCARVAKKVGMKSLANLLCVK